jgi:hypothetical protein
MEMVGVLKGLPALFSFGSFNARCVMQLFDEAANGNFDKEENNCSRCKKTIKTTAAVVLGILSRAPSAAIPFITPGLSRNQQLFQSMLFVTTAAPEALAALRSIQDAHTAIIDRQLSQNSRKVLLQLRHALGAHIDARLKMVINGEFPNTYFRKIKTSGKIQNSPINELQNVYLSFLHPDVHVLAQQKLDATPTSSCNSGSFRKIASRSISAITGTLFTYQNALLVKIALESLFDPSNSDWTMPVSLGLSAILSHVLYSGIAQSADKFSQFGKRYCSQEKESIAQKYYFKVYTVGDLLIQLQAACLYWTMKAEAEATVGLEKTYDKLLLAGTTTAIFLLVYNSINELFEEGIASVGGYFNPQTKEMLESYRKLKKIKETLAKTTLRAFALCLTEAELNDAQLRMLAPKGSLAQLRILLETLSHPEEHEMGQTEEISQDTSFYDDGDRSFSDPEE